VSAVKTEAGKEFSLSPVEHRLCFQEQPGLAPERNRSGDVNELIGIFSRIARLFDLEANCCFRLSDHDFAKASAVDLDLPTPGSQDFDFSVEHENNPDCGVCSLDAEHVLLRQDESAHGATSLYRGIGCAMMSDICFGIKEKCPDDQTHEHVGRAKQMLLSLSDRIPAALRLSDTARPASSSTWMIRAYLGQSLWSTMDVWRSFVLESRNLLALSQALLVLVSGVDREKLPPWWRSEGAGWGKPQMLLTRPSRSNLLLLIRVLDLAVAEFSAAEAILPPYTKTDGPSYLPASFTTLPFPERTAQTLKWADELGIGRWQGEYEMYCSRCQDGGDLLCCELCSNVDHAACFRPPLVDIPDYYVCEPCMTDIHALHSARQ
jgi:hypothetical protein